MPKSLQIFTCFISFAWAKINVYSNIHSTKEVQLMSKKLCFGVILTSTLSIGALLASGLALKKNSTTISRVKGDIYTLTLDKNQSPSGMSSMQGLQVDKTVTTSAGNTIKLNYNIAKTDGNSFVILGNHGSVYSTADSSTNKNKISSIKSITVDFATTGGSLSLQTSSRNDGLGWGAPVALTSGSTVNLTNAPYYFRLTAGDAYTTINEIQIEYECVPNNVLYLENIAGTYTGQGNDGNIYKLTLNGGDAHLESLTRESPVEFDGTFALTTGSQGAITMNVAGYDVTYTVSISDDSHELEYVSKAGATANYVPEIDFYRVYTVENFDNYTQTGYGYDKKDWKEWYQTTGVKSSFYSQYYGGADESGYDRMGNNDYISLTSEHKHGTSGKSVAFKAMNNNKMRYVQNKVYYGEPTSIGKGNYLSFWALGVAQDVTVDVYAYKYNGVTRLNNNTLLSTASYFTTGQVTVPAGSPWSQYFIALEDGVEYKGFGIKNNKTSSGTVYMPIDDVEIYTHNPWATPSVPVTSVSLDKDSIELWPDRTATLTATVAPNNATNKNVSWSSSNTSVATVADGVVTAKAVGSTIITVTTQDGSKTDTCEVTVVAMPTFLSGLFIGDVSATIAGQSGTYPVLIATGDQGYIEYCFNGKNAGYTNYTTNGSSFSLTAKDSVSFTIASYTITVYPGTISGTVEDGTFKNCSITGATVKINSGDPSSFVPTNNGSITFAKQTAMFNNCDGDRAALQTMFDRRWRAWGNPTPPWNMDTTNPSKVDASTAHYMDGTGAMSFRGYNQGEAQLVLANDLSGAAQTAFNNISFWVYNAGTARTLSYFAYSEADFGGPINNFGSKTIPSGQWTFITCGFSVENLYNIALHISGAQTNDFFFDNFCLYHY